MDTNPISPGVELQHILSGHSDLILHIAWSKDGKFLASPSRDKTIRIWNTETGEISTILEGHAARINTTAWSNDGTRLVSGCGDGTLGLWTIGIGKQTSKLEVISKFETSIYDLAWSPDNTMLATACEDGKVRIWSFKLKQVDTIDAHRQGVNSVAWSPNGKLLASASADRTIAIWEISNNKWQKSQTIDAHLHSVNSIDWSSNGEFLVSAARKTVKIWNPDSLSQEPLKLIQAQPDDAGFIKSVTFSHDFQLLAAKCQSSDVPVNNIVRIWNCDTWQLVASISEPTTSTAANSIAFHPHLPILATQGEDDKVIRLWNLANLDNPKTKLTNKKKAVIVGIDKYKNLNSELKTCTADARVVAQLLQKMGWEIQGGMAILNEEATVEKLQDSLKQLFQPNDRENSDYTALFYFSGLGAGVEDYSWGAKITADRKGDLVAYDSSLETSISLSWLYELLQASSVEQQLVWLDSDFSGRFIEIARQDEIRNNRYNRCLISSSQKDEFAIDQPSSKKQQNGVFSKALLNLVSSKLELSAQLVNSQILEELNGTELPSGQHPIVFNSGQPISLIEKLSDESLQNTSITENETENIKTASLQTAMPSLVKGELPPWIFGMNDPGDWRDLVEQAKKKAWVMFHQVVGHDPNHQVGNPQFVEWAQAGHGVLARLVNAPFSIENKGDGSIPIPENYESFAQSCANFVRNSPGCHIWFIGEEMNVSWHWPSRKKTSQPISPEDYASCFKLVRDAIKQVQPHAYVIPSGLNSALKFPTNVEAKLEDGLKWFGEIIDLIDELDGFDIHCNFPSEKNSYGYEEFLKKIPKNKLNLPIFLTEVTPPDPWTEKANNWMQETYKKIDLWNNDNSHDLQIYALLPYRWQETFPDGRPDPWNLVNKSSYRQDFSDALKNDYRWNKQTTIDISAPIEPITENLNLPKEKVEEIQTLLTQTGRQVKIDGDYGSETQKAVEKFRSETLGSDATELVNPATIVQFLQLEPPHSNDTIRIEIGTDTIRLDYENKKYSNPNLLTKEPQMLASLMSVGLLSNWQEYGKLLFEAIINDEPNDEIGGDSVQTGYRIARSQIGNKRLRVEVDIDPNRMSLHQYKWEYLKDPRDDSPLAVYEHSPLYRCPKNNSSDPVEANPLRILILICNPSTLKEPQPSGRINPVGTASNSLLDGLVKIDVAQEQAIIETGLKRLKKAGLIEYDFLHETENSPRATLNNTIDLLREKSYHILHVVAHGFLMGDRFMLLMENEHGEHDFVDAKQFSSAMFGDSLRLVVLASCQTAQTDTENAIRGLGARLSNLGIPAVIAMQDAVPMTTAQLFTQYFYDHLARSGRIDMAMAATRFDLFRRREGATTGDWGIPVLFMNSGGGRLFDVDRQKASNVAPLQPAVTSYDRLPGRGDPRPQVLASNLENLARQHNFNSEQIALLRSLTTSVGSNTQPLAAPQNRANLQAKITKDFKIDPIDPKELENHATISLPAHVYGQIASALNTGKHLILIGPPGTGKTTIANDICQYIKTQGGSAGSTLTTATADWTTFDTIGGYVPTPQQTLQFRLGIFLHAIAQGNWLVVDEINRSDIDKSFGELFTVLSGQAVDLPYSINDQPVSILPAKDWETKKEDDPNNYTYIIHPNWRVIGTMNVYDKSSLFNLSFAFMRRFAFIEIEVPADLVYQEKLLIDRDNGWFVKWKAEKKDKEVLRVLQSKLLDVLRLRDTADTTLLADLHLSLNPLMSCRSIGPAIIKDMVDYIGDRYQPGGDIINCLGEAFMLYLSPQLDGIAQDAIVDIHRFVGFLFKDRDISVSILNRIELLYPHIREWQNDDK